MPVTRRTRTIAAAPEAVWAVVSDPHHLPRWWPRVRRMESVDHDRFTMVMPTAKGRPVRADFRVLASEPPRRRAWTQELAGGPFARLLTEATTALELAPREHATEVSIELRQRLRGWSRFGGFMFRRAARTQLDEALAGLERIVGA